MIIREFDATDFLTALAWEARHNGCQEFVLSYKELRQKLSRITDQHPEVRINMGLVELTSFERLESNNIKIELLSIKITNLQSSEMGMIIEKNRPSDDICRLLML
jgi:hypothetical protein